MNIIITGASKGIGFAVAKAFATSGNRLLLCARNKQKLEEAANLLRTEHPAATYFTYPADLAVKEQAVAFGNWCLTMGIPDILVNNAGQYVPGNVHDEAEGQMEQMIAVNLYSAYYVTRTLIPAMKEKGGGQIFNMCSVASLQAYTGGGSYSVSKFALLGFSKNLREELKTHHIKVISVLPGAVYTPSWEASGVPPERIMEASDIGRIILAISALSPQANVEDIVLRPQLGDL
jgi:short-subunit dehydrogenase